MKRILLSLALLFFAGCSTTYPVITEYRIETDRGNLDTIVSRCEKKSLTVAQVFVSSSLMSKKMKYIVGKYKEYAYNHSEWAENPNRAITDEIVQLLQASHVFKTVDSYKSFSRSDYTLESRVDDFSQYFSEDEKSSFVVVDITFSLIDNKSAKVIASKHIKKIMNTKTANAASGVTALNEALTETLSEMSKWIAGSCQ